MEPAGEIERLINPTVEQLGFRVVRVKFFARPRRTLQIMAERGDGSPVVVEDCAAISRAVSVVLDTEDPIRGAYDLEVSSTGIDRPLVKIGDFERFGGFEATVTVDPPVADRKRFRGRITGVEAGEVVLMMKDGAEARLPFDAITEAKLVLTDELLAAAVPPVNEDVTPVER